MLDNTLIYMVNLSRLVAVNEYLRERDDKQVCAILDDVISAFQMIMTNLKQK